MTGNGLMRLSIVIPSSRSRAPAQLLAALQPLRMHAVWS